jgi:asparagine synthase (glutamine-hydrolysing)
MFENSNHLGFFNPYFIKKDGFFQIKNTFVEIIKLVDEPKKIDLISIIELLNRNYFLGDRTIIQGINKSPWMAKPNENNNEWVFHDLPIHKEINFDEANIAEELFIRLQKEILSYIGEKKSIGILLSGGMDSRIVAGTLDYLIKSEILADEINVTALTWGNENSRDVVYAKRIAEKLKWDWKHYRVTAENLKNNIDEVAINGCEFSPIHLHALPQIRDDNKLDCVLAGSYGDSIGRAEYSGVKVNNLKAQTNNFRNVGAFLKQSAFKDMKGKWMPDTQKYHALFPEEKLYQQYELDNQLHYMRRMLNPCMKFIGFHNPLQQVFTSPDVYGFMWSIIPKKRNNEVYKLIISKFKTDFSNIPWARTGLPYAVTEGSPDSFDKEHHSYKEFIDNELYEEIKNLVLSEEIKSLEVFNLQSLTQSFELIKSQPHTKQWYEEKLIWLASLSKAISLYDIKNDKIYKNNSIDVFNNKVLVPLEFYGRNKSIFKIFKKWNN